MIVNKKPTRYQQLKVAVREFAHQVANPKRVVMWTYPKAKLADGNWNLADLYERVKAAESLGYDVALSSECSGLVVCYVAKRPSPPFELKY